MDFTTQPGINTNKSLKTVSDLHSKVFQTLLISIVVNSFRNSLVYECHYLSYWTGRLRTVATNFSAKFLVCFSQSGYFFYTSVLLLQTICADNYLKNQVLFLFGPLLKIICSLVPSAFAWKIKLKPLGLCLRSWFTSSALSDFFPYSVSILVW